MKNKKKNKDKGKSKDNLPNSKTKKNKSEYAKGARTLKDIITSPSFSFKNDTFGRVGSKFVRSFAMKGYPGNVHVGWLNELFNYEGDMDTTIYIVPADERSALNELTKKITQYESQLAIENDKGSVRNATIYKNKIIQLYQQRERLELNYENLFHVGIFANLFTDTEEELNKQTQVLDNTLKGRRMNLMPLYLRQKKGYRSGLPFGEAEITDVFRNMNSGGTMATAMAFYNSDISHKNGVFIGVNKATGSPIFINFYDRNVLLNSNISVLAPSGSGKSYFVSLLTTRSALQGIRTFIIDPERDYEVITKELGGTTIKLSPSSSTKINPFDVEEEDMFDDNDMPTGEKTVNLGQKISDVLNLIAVMSGGLSQELKSVVSMTISKTYSDFGFTENPESLYKPAEYDAGTGEFRHDGFKKTMPVFTDFHNRLVDFAKENNHEGAKSLALSLQMFKKGGAYDMFDAQTSKDIDFENTPIVTFDIKDLEAEVFRPIGMYVAMTLTWEKFVKKNPHIQKRVICDEAWMLFRKAMAGHEYSSMFLENIARRIRKYNGGLLVATQDSKELTSNPQGEAVLKNSFVNIFLKQNEKTIDGIQKDFKLSDGEKLFLLGAKQGEFLVRMNGESSVGYALAFELEHELITRKAANAHKRAAQK